MESKHPLLLISHGDFKQHHLIYNPLENSFRVLNIPILRCTQILASCYGWLVLSKPRTDDCFLWNPISMDKIDLPKLEHASLHNTCVLSKPPTEPDCHVILFNSFSTSELSFCRIGDEEFSHEVKKDEEHGNRRKLRAAVASNSEGKIYGFVDPGNLLVSIHFVGKTLEFRPIMTVRLSLQFSRPYYVMWLIESPKLCGDELLLVQKIHSCRYITEGLEFKVYQVDLNQMKCVELEYIGERAIFVSHNGGGFCRSSSSTTNIKANSIYYTDMHSRSLYVFDLEDMSTTLLSPSSVAGYESVTSWVEHHVFPVTN